MAVGLAASRANAILGTMRAGGGNITAGAVYLKLHTGDPGSAGTANASAMTTRNAVGFLAPSAGSMLLDDIDPFAMTATEVVSHGSLWTAATAGTFLQSGALAVAIPVINGSTVSFTVVTLAYTPIAA